MSKIGEEIGGGIFDEDEEDEEEDEEEDSKPVALEEWVEVVVESDLSEWLSLEVDEQGWKADSVVEKKISSALEARVVQEAEELDL